MRLGVVVGGDGAFDQADVVGALQHGAAGLGEVDDVDGARQRPAGRPRRRAGSTGSRRRRRT